MTFAATHVKCRAVNISLPGVDCPQVLDRLVVSFPWTNALGPCLQSLSAQDWW